MQSPVLSPTVSPAFFRRMPQRSFSHSSLLPSSLHVSQGLEEAMGHRFFQEVKCSIQRLFAATNRCRENMPEALERKDRLIKARNHVPPKIACQNICSSKPAEGARGTLNKGNRFASLFETQASSTLHRPATGFNLISLRDNQAKRGGPARVSFSALH